MAGPKKINKGQRLGGIPADGWNAFVDTSHKVDQLRTQQQGQASSDRGGPVYCFIRNDSGSDVPNGGVLALGAPVTVPATRAEVVLEGLAFVGELPVADAPTQHVAISIEPIADGAFGYGIIPGAVWAKVNVSDDGHLFAQPKASVSELRSHASQGFPIIWKESGTGAGKWAVISLSKASDVVTVYQFANCTNEARTLYLDNPEIASHADGGEDEDKQVAAIKIDGVAEYWKLLGPAPRCKTGECADILGWWTSCDERPCFNLTPCGGGSPIVVRDIEWIEYEGEIVKINGVCYTVTLAEGCFDVDENITVDDITERFNDCDRCGCYELTGCSDDTVIWVDNNIAGVVGEETGAAAIGKFVKFKGVCYEITDFEAPCTQETVVHWDYDAGLCGFGFVDRFLCPWPVDSCNGCCYLLMPCEGQAGDPQNIYVRPTSSDTVNLDEFVDLETGESNGRALMLADNICYTVSIPDICNEEEVVVGVGTVREEYESCEECGITCWKECGSEPAVFIRTYSAIPLEYRNTNTALKRAEDGKCYVYESSPGTCGEPEIVVFTIEAAIEEGSESCEICQDPRVKLTPACGSSCGDCSGGSSGGSGSGGDPIVSDQPGLFAAVGQYVKVDGECHSVEWTTDEVTSSEVCWSGPFETCEACRAAPSKIVVLARRGDAHVEVALEGYFNVCGESAIPPCEEA